MSKKGGRDSAELNRRSVLLGGTTLAAAIGAGASTPIAQAQEVLPRPEPPFKGVIGTTYKDSTPDKIPLVTAPCQESADVPIPL